MDMSKVDMHRGGAGVSAEDALRCETLNVFRSQLHQLSRHKDQLMPKPDGSFPDEWIRLAWHYQSLAEEIMRSQRWSRLYPEGLLACVNEQVKYLRRRLEHFALVTDEEKKDKFRRVYVLAALGIIAKLKLVTFCWTFVELKRGEQFSYASSSSQGMPGSLLHGGGGAASDFSCRYPSAAFGGPVPHPPHKMHPAPRGIPPQNGADAMDASGLLVGQGPPPLGLYDPPPQLPPGMTLEDFERKEYTTRSGRKTHRTPMKPEKS